MPSCSVVIRAYNEAAHIGRLLEGLFRQTLHDVEIILVDSGSTDSTVDLAAAAGADVLHIPPAEFTFGRSLNLGLAAAASDLVVIASAHVHPVYPDWLEHLLEAIFRPTGCADLRKAACTGFGAFFRTAGLSPLVSGAFRTTPDASIL